MKLDYQQRWSNAADRQSQKKGIIGILGMALALAIVSFSCTGPIVGTLLVEAASKGGTAPIIACWDFLGHCATLLIICNIPRMVTILT